MKDIFLATTHLALRKYIAVWQICTCPVARLKGMRHCCQETVFLRSVYPLSTACLLPTLSLHRTALQESSYRSKARPILLHVEVQIRFKWNLQWVK